PEPNVEHTKEDGETLHRVHGKRVVVGETEVRALMVSVVFTNAEHEAWAREVYASIRFE
ncbi:MAG: hypothetical protein JNK82_03860, partial [Myxococcaceae bacterium]|nr:hypothetical protein [Myxococcaceae bacterium]